MISICSYWSQNINANHYSLAITILTTVIIGGCLILLVENQHTQGEVITRYYNVMRPFYHKLTLYAKFVQQCLFALVAIDEDGKRYKKKLKDLCFDLKAIANNSILSGKDTPLLNAKYLESICTNINDIWYVFDRNYEMYCHLKFDDFHFVDGVRNALIAYDRNLSDKNIDVHLLPQISGDFYVKEWQPIDNIPFLFEYFVNESKKIGYWLYASFIIEITSLVIVYISESFNCISLLAVDMLVILSLSSFMISLFKFLKIKSLIIKMQF